jgi:hypothetical protein
MTRPPFAVAISVVSVAIPVSVLVLLVAVPISIPRPRTLVVSFAVSFPLTFTSLFPLAVAQ